MRRAAVLVPEFSVATIQNSDDATQLQSAHTVANSSRRNRSWIFLLSAWLCYLRWMSTTSTANHDKLSWIIPGRVASSPPAFKLSYRDSAIESRIVKKVGKDSSNTPRTNIGSAEKSAEGVLQPESALEELSLVEESNLPLPLIGSTLALSGKCASPDYGIRLFYIKTKHTGSSKMSGILRRIGMLHDMVVADPAKGRNSFKSDADFHQIAQGKCVDYLVAHVKRGAWLDKAFKGALKFTSIRDPMQRAISAYMHSKECGEHCAMCWKFLDDKVEPFHHSYSAETLVMTNESAGQVGAAVRGHSRRTVRARERAAGGC
jgi:hypothetical protein